MTTATTWRKERGRQTEKLLAEWFRGEGWPYAEPVGAGRPGADLTGLPGLSVEVKATRSCSPLAWLKQARTRPWLRAVIWRPDGQGETTIASHWPVIIDLSTFTSLLRAAGYGDDDDS